MTHKKIIYNLKSFILFGKPRLIFILKLNIYRGYKLHVNSSMYIVYKISNILKESLLSLFISASSPVTFSLHFLQTLEVLSC